MIPLLRAGSFAANLLVFAGVPYLLGAGAAASLATAGGCFVLSWWGCARAPSGDEAPADVRADAEELARRMGAPPPRFVRRLPGWTAAAVSAGRGYGVLVGADVEARHRPAVLAHEIAHVTSGDLAWEPFTDGPARLCLQAARQMPLLWVIALPFLAAGAPLARATELAADRLASDTIPGYASVLREVASTLGAGPSVLYPGLGARVRHSARHSLHERPSE
jgi:Zn-dependent protease with chaperone function